MEAIYNCGESLVRNKNNGSKHTLKNRTNILNIVLQQIQQNKPDPLSIRVITVYVYPYFKSLNYFILFSNFQLIKLIFFLYYALLIILIHEFKFLIILIQRNDLTYQINVNTKRKRWWGEGGQPDLSSSLATNQFSAVLIFY